MQNEFVVHCPGLVQSRGKAPVQKAEPQVSRERDGVCTDPHRGLLPGLGLFFPRAVSGAAHGGAGGGQKGSKLPHHRWTGSPIVLSCGQGRCLIWLRASLRTQQALYSCTDCFEEVMSHFVWFSFSRRRYPLGGEFSLKPRLQPWQNVTGRVGRVEALELHLCPSLTGDLWRGS